MRVALPAFRGLTFTRGAAMHRTVRLANGIYLALTSKYEAKSYRHEAKSDRHKAKSYRPEARSDRHGMRSDRHGARSFGHGAKSDRHKAKSFRHETKSFRYEEKSLRREGKSFRQDAKSLGTSIGIKKAGATFGGTSAVYTMGNAAMLGSREVNAAELCLSKIDLRHLLVLGAGRAE